MSPDYVPSSLARVQGRGITIHPVTSAVSERRQRRRYQFTAESQCILNGNRERATTADISSGGVFFRTETPLPVGKWIELLIDWPVLLNHQCPIRLVVHGRVRRSDARGTAVEIVRHDFRLRPRTPTPVRSGAILAAPNIA